jgi:hypothetical protein
MKIEQHPFETIDWRTIEKVKYAGEKGFALWQTIMMGDIRIRMVEYSAGYIADHWCNKGHVIYCIEGKMKTELQDGRIMKLKKGMTYHVGDDSEAHRTSSKKGCKLFIVD